MTDAHLVELSQRISNTELLFDLGIKVLKLHHNVIDAALTNEIRDIWGAAHSILNTWYMAQVDKQQAYVALSTALIENQLSMFAAELMKWVERPAQDREQKLEEGTWGYLDSFLKMK